MEEQRKVNVSYTSKAWKSTGYGLACISFPEQAHIFTVCLFFVLSSNFRTGNKTTFAPIPCHELSPFASTHEHDIITIGPTHFRIST